MNIVVALCVLFVTILVLWSMMSKTAAPYFSDNVHNRRPLRPREKKFVVVLILVCVGVVAYVHYF